MNPNESNSEKNRDIPIEPVEDDVESAPTFIEPPYQNSAEEAEKKSQEETVKVDFKNKKEEEASNVSNGMKDAVDYVKQNKEDLITYIFLLAGLLFLVWGDFFVGSLILGLIAGYHFSHEIVFYLRNLSHIFDGHEHLRFLVLTAVIIGLFLAIPGMFFGSIIAAVFKYVIFDKKDSF